MSVGRYEHIVVPKDEEDMKNDQESTNQYTKRLFNYNSDNSTYGDGDGDGNNNTNDTTTNTDKIMPVVLKVTQYQDLYGSFWKLPCPTNLTDGPIYYSSILEDFSDTDLTNSDEYTTFLLGLF